MSPAIQPPDLLRVISERETSGLTGLSVATLRRLRKDGTWPRHVQLSARRIGYRVSDVAAWLSDKAAQRPPL